LCHTFCRRPAADRRELTYNYSLSELGCQEDKKTGSVLICV